MNKNKLMIEAARKRVEADTIQDLVQVGKDIITRLRIPHTKTLKQSGGLQFTWNWIQTRLTPRYVSYLMDKLGYKPLNSSETAPMRNEYSDGNHRVLIAPEYGIIVVRPLSKEPVTSSTQEDQFEFEDYEEWLNSAKTNWPDARHNKQGTAGYVPGYGEPEDEEFVTGPDMQSEVVAAWVSEDEYGWVFKRTVTSSLENDEEFDEFEDYSEWLRSVKQHRNVHLSGGRGVDDESIATVDGNPVGVWTHSHESGWSLRAT